MVVTEKPSSQEEPWEDENSMAFTSRGFPYIDLSEGEGVALTQAQNFGPSTPMDQPRSMVCLGDVLKSWLSIQSSLSALTLGSLRALAVSAVIDELQDLLF